MGMRRAECKLIVDGEGDAVGKFNMLREVGRI